MPSSDNQPPQVSVIIPAFNAEQFIAEAIQSVLAQTNACHEIIVIDDGSTDKTTEVLKTFDGKIRCLYQQNKGPSAARNAGIQVAQGELICFLDADDLWTPDKLEVQLAFMEANPDVALVFSDHEEFNEEGIVLSSYLGEKRKAFESFPIATGPLENAFAKLVVENFISTPTVMVRKSCLEKAGVFDEEIRSVEDRDLWLRIAALSTIACIPRIFCKRRFHQANISKHKELTVMSRIRVLEKNWRLFPGLVPDRIWRKELAASYFSLGCLLLQKGERWRAFQAVSHNFVYEAAIVLSDRSLAVRPTLKSLGLLCAVLVGWHISRFLWRPWKNAFHIAP